MKFLIALIALVPSIAGANIVCHGKTDLGPIQVELSNDRRSARVTGPFFSKPRIFKNLERANGLFTAHGLALTFQNAYGCLRGGELITDLREPFDAGYMGTVKLGTCSGGSTPDEICLGRPR